MGPHRRPLGNSPAMMTLPLKSLLPVMVIVAVKGCPIATGLGELAARSKSSAGG